MAENRKLCVLLVTPPTERPNTVILHRKKQPTLLGLRPFQIHQSELSLNLRVLVRLTGFTANDSYEQDTSIGVYGGFLLPKDSTEVVSHSLQNGFLTSLTAHALLTSSVAHRGTYSVDRI